MRMYRHSMSIWPIHVTRSSSVACVYLCMYDVYMLPSDVCMCVRRHLAHPLQQLFRLCVYMYICDLYTYYACLYVMMGAYTYILTYPCVPTCVRTYTHRHMHACMHALFTLIDVPYTMPSASNCDFTCTYIQTYIHTHAHPYTHAHIHTHTHTWFILGDVPHTVSFLLYHY
jgi:hypothetical protein